MTNEQMLSPYQDTTRLMREMEMQGIPVTMANLAIHRKKEEEMRQERMRYDQILQKAAAEKAREENKGKARMVEEEEDEDTDELASSASEEWERGLGYTLYMGGKIQQRPVLLKANPIQVVKPQFHPLIKGIIGRLIEDQEKKIKLCNNRR
ncbi:hypothetical protein PIB30_036097 [Stylosanthes scabra]|uniref:Uncharacterized protein n=1 Tax=Stylosanthes scabra TaxID=79078 RepID=A0ABU6TD18_9FABA|nr:hypothetical protein [Stylosanthes scabra]